MPSKKGAGHQKRKKSTGVLSNSLIRGGGGGNVAQIHQTLQLKHNLRDIYASASSQPPAKVRHTSQYSYN